MIPEAAFLDRQLREAVRCLWQASGARPALLATPLSWVLGEPARGLSDVSTRAHRRAHACMHTHPPRNGPLLGPCPCPCPCPTQQSPRGGPVPGSGKEAEKSLKLRNSKLSWGHRTPCSGTTQGLGLETKPREVAGGPGWALASLGTDLTD